MTRMSTLLPLLALLSAGTLAAEARYNPFAGRKAEPPAAASTGTGTAAAGRLSNLVLKGVIPNGSPPMANIDGQIIAVGEKFGSYTLVAVGEQGVTLARGGRHFRLEFVYGRTQEGGTVAVPGASS